MALRRACTSQKKKASHTWSVHTFPAVLQNKTKQNTSWHQLIQIQLCLTRKLGNVSVICKHSNLTTLNGKISERDTSIPRQFIPSRYAWKAMKKCIQMTLQSLSNCTNQGWRKPQTESQWSKGAGRKTRGTSIGLSGWSFLDLGSPGKTLPLTLCFRLDTVYIQEVVICGNSNNQYLAWKANSSCQKSLPWRM